MNLIPTKYDGYYVCEDGSIWTEWHGSKGRGLPRKMNQFYRGGVENHRYLCINVTLKNELGKVIRQKQIYSHRLIAETLIPNPNNLPEIDHIDYDKTNNNISNLRWVDRKENQRWMKNSGGKIPTREMRGF